MHAQNYDKLTKRDKALLAFIFAHMTDPVVGVLVPYAVEVKADNVEDNLFHGNEELSIHWGNGSKEYYHHEGDPEWINVHVEDKEWTSEDVPGLLIVGEVLIKEYAAKHDFSYN
jgi:hypothetical protein